MSSFDPTELLVLADAFEERGDPMADKLRDLPAQLGVCLIELVPQPVSYEMGCVFADRAAEHIWTADQEFDPAAENLRWRIHHLCQEGILAREKWLAGDLDDGGLANVHIRIANLLFFHGRPITMPAQLHAIIRAAYYLTRDEPVRVSPLTWVAAMAVRATGWGNVNRDDSPERHWQVDHVLKWMWAQATN